MMVKSMQAINQGATHTAGLHIYYLTCKNIKIKFAHLFYGHRNAGCKGEGFAKIFLISYDNLAY